MAPPDLFDASQVRGGRWGVLFASGLAVSEKTKIKEEEEEEEESVCRDVMTNVSRRTYQPLGLRPMPDVLRLA